MSAAIVKSIVMIFEVLNVITEEINSYLVDGTSVTLDNIATIDTDNGDTPNGPTGIILSLLNLQEEFTLKNIPNHYVSGTEINYRNPKVNLNLFILFSANQSSYTESLKSLSKVLEFFQGKKVFTQDNTTYSRESEGMEKLKNFKFLVDLYTPTFEELNFIWGTLGGKQYPSVIYKVSLVEIERDITQSKGTLITQIDNILERI